MCLEFLHDLPRAHVGLPWLSLVGLRPSCLDGCLSRLTWAHLSGNLRVHLMAKGVLHLFTSCLGAQFKVKPPAFVVIPMPSFPQSDQFLLILIHEFSPFHLSRDLFLCFCRFHGQSFVSSMHPLLSSSVPASSTPAGNLMYPCSCLFHDCVVRVNRCRCALVHLLCTRIPTCLTLVTVRTLALTNPGPPSSHAASTNILRSATIVLVPGMPLIVATHCILEFTSADARSGDRTPLAHRAAHKKFRVIFVPLLASPPLIFVRSDDDIGLTVPDDVSNFFTCRPLSEVAMRREFLLMKLTASSMHCSRRSRPSLVSRGIRPLPLEWSLQLGAPTALFSSRFFLERVAR